MEYRNFPIQDQQGNALPAASAYIYEPGTTTQVAVYDDDGNPLTQPLRPSPLGVLSFAAENGVYDIAVVNEPSVVRYENEKFLDVNDEIAAVNQAVSDAQGYAAEAQSALPFDSVPDLLASTRAALGVGSIWRADGHLYEEVDPSATDQHITTAGGVKLYVKPKDYGFDVMAFGCAGDGTTDDAAALQSAIDAAQPLGADVRIPSGTVCALGATVDIKTGTALVGGSGRKRPYTLEENVPGIIALPALGSDPMFTMANGDDNNTTRRSHGLYGLRIDGASVATVGVFCQNAVQSVIEGNQFENFVTGGAAIKMGACLYQYVKRNSFLSGEYYALDALDSYKGGALHYYGVNVGTFEENIVSCHYGIRYQGTFEVLRNDFELRTEAGTAIKVEAGQSSYTNIVGNYFECLIPTTNPSAGHKLIELGSTVQIANIEGNYLYGSKGASGVAIDASTLSAGTLAIQGNWVADIETGASFRTLGGPDLHIGPNEFRPDVTTHYSGQAIRNSVTAAGATNNVFPHQRMIIDGAEHTVGAQQFGAVFVRGQTGLNLDHGNAFYIDTLSVAATYDTIVNPRQGQMFWVSAVKGGFITLANSAFNLACGSDLLLPQDKPLLFMVDDSGTVREVGDGSRALWTGTVSQLPSAATLGAGARLFVTDATATTFASAVAGGGANSVPVYSDGTSWLIG